MWWDVDTLGRVSLESIELDVQSGRSYAKHYKTLNFEQTSALKSK